MKPLKPAKALRELHAHLIRKGIHKDPNSISPVLTSYTSSPTLLHKARVLFDQMDHPTTFTSNTMIRAYSQSDQALHIYNQMRTYGLTLNDLTFIFITKTCGRLRDTLHGQEAHLTSMKLGFGSYLYVSNAFIHMYSTCGDFVSARRLFDETPERDLVSWNGLICGYSGNNQFEEVLNLFKAMRVEGVKGDAVTMVKVVLACRYLGHYEVAENVVNYIEENNVEIDVYLGNVLIEYYGQRGVVGSARNVFDNMYERNLVSWNSMIMSYVKVGNLMDARGIFDRMPVKDVISWTTMINGYSRCDRYSDALDLFREMMVAKVKPDELTVTSVISSCAHLGKLDVGMSVHEYIYSHNVKVDVHLGNSLIYMYFKCGCTHKALEVFENMVEKDAVSWTSVVTGFAVNGYAREALKYYSDMLKECVRPSDATFVGVLIACTHAGLVDEGLYHFETMKNVYRIEPKMKHYGCVVDLLSRSGLLGKAYKFIQSIPGIPDATVWRILLSACKLQDNVVLAEIAMKKLLELDPSNSGNYVLLSNAYASADRWTDAVSVRNLMNESDVKKEAGCSSVEWNSLVTASTTKDTLFCEKF